MPVEDRLRRGLEANARAFVPEGEKRLADVRRRHRARTGALAAAVAAAVVAVVVVAVVAAGSRLGGSDGSPVPAPRPTHATPSTGAYTGPRIPDSGWRKVVTRAQLVRAGADDAYLAENIGRADRLPTTLSFIGDVYSHSGRYPGGWSVGDAGTLDYDSAGHLVLTRTAPACRGCIISLTWRIRGDRLVLDGFRGTPDDPMAQVMLEGVWTRFGT